MEEKEKEQKMYFYQETMSLAITIAKDIVSLVVQGCYTREFQAHVTASLVSDIVLGRRSYVRVLRRYHGGKAADVFNERMTTRIKAIRKIRPCYRKAIAACLPKAVEKVEWAKIFF